MKYEGTTYRPPVECDSMLLQVTVGCSHNECTFCNMYRDVKFRVSSMEEIESDLQEARGIYPKAERVFLVNGDAFVLKADALKAIAEKILEYFPECRNIGMYASIKNIRNKTDAELAELRKLKINDFHVGVESGMDSVLEHLKKGHTVKDAVHHLNRLTNAGIQYATSLMLGAAGAGKGAENAEKTADLLNQVRPSLIWLGTMGVFKTVPLYQDILSGSFTLPTELEVLEEEKALIKSIAHDDVLLQANHPTNLVSMFGRLPRDREKMIDHINAAIAHYGEDALSVPTSRLVM
ncbi:Radical SAM domain protein [Desulfatibacillum aliphaticivorans]|uniref:Radical SAM domain protein n=1 Tax=Desulfatibacillum aliphaticivorans TaxID=218208 RepID=B8FL69_DESAL|nr:radical SAM protein [Desulfatibacillum aliphaticivorans]ACL04704.1 Radical SAM domain protein [Desulfatibacillum aliphaticivorans]